MQQEQKNKVIDALLTIAEHIGEYGLNELEAALHYKRQVARSEAIEPCKPGYTRDADGICQKDPVPPDPTHQ